MTTDSLTDLLFRQTLLFSAAVLLVALLRPLLLRSLGARTTYVAWLLVPLLMASPLLPRPPLLDAAQLAPFAAPAAVRVAIAQALPNAQPLSAAPAAGATTWPCFAWAAGALLTALIQIALQRRYVAGLHRGSDGRWLAPAGASPAVVGVWPQHLVLPQDFEQRFDGLARRLVLAHEAVHARRRDNAWNLLAATLLCLQWFNPLAWWAWLRLRDDQELACDAAVLAAETGPAPLAAYAQAMLAAHPAGWQPALASGWAARHPLVQRVHMLARHRTASGWRHLGGVLLVLGLGSGAALLARAAQAPTPAGKAPTGQGMVLELSSQLAGGDWTHRTMALPGKGQPIYGGPWGVVLNMPQPGWCLNVMLHGFEDGSWRPTGQVLDETCQYALSDWQPLTVNGSAVQFIAKTAQGPLQAQLSAHWADPAHPALPALMQADLEAAPKLSPAQAQMQARQREQVAEFHRLKEAQDRAWREAREASSR